jgi:hypothetical protein
MKDESQIDPRLYRVSGIAGKSFGLQVLFDPMEKDLNLPLFFVNSAKHFFYRCYSRNASDRL